MPLYKIPPEGRVALKKYFDSHSSNGLMSSADLQAILAKMAVKTTAQLQQQIIDSISVTPKGITFQAFIDFVATRQALRNDNQEFAEAFRLFDRQGNGYLVREDIKYVLQKLGIAVSNLDDLMEKADTNKDNKISYTEFVDLMKQ